MRVTVSEVDSRVVTRLNDEPSITRHVATRDLRVLVSKFGTAGDPFEVRHSIGAELAKTLGDSWNKIEASLLREVQGRGTAELTIIFDRSVSAPVGELESQVWSLLPFGQAREPLALVADVQLRFALAGVKPISTPTHPPRVAFFDAFADAVT